ncbi:Endoplasmic reticulum transmembrane protein 3 [Neofusicoccum ribis]|uniref:Endoplasmic reticulum transmembrane protein n=1 Tax=Neofusicoccum ribis TaxID=45134 RepID=A0ABR3SW19_9PEZI
MTLYYSLVFILLVAEMVVFMSLIVPLPFTWRRKLFTFISESPLIAKLQYGMKITFIFILILAAVIGGHERMEVQARKFYSQRNMYLCGFTLFLSLILNRTYVMILDVLRLEEENKSLRGDSAAKGKDSAALGKAGDAGEIGRLKKELADKDRDIEHLKKQAEGLSREYNRLGDEVSGSDSVPKKDR